MLVVFALGLMFNPGLCCSGNIDRKLSDMESKNPFVQRIQAEPEQLELFDDIDDKDLQRYFFRGQTLKFLHPEKFSFLKLPMEFFAFYADDDMNVTSMMLYLEYEENMLQILEEEFGAADLSLNLQGEAEYEEGDAETLTFTSHTWVKGQYRMTFSFYPVNDAGGETRSLKAQIYIVQ